MANEEQAIEDAGAAIIWVLEQDPQQRPGTREGCEFVMDEFDSVRGICVGDAETRPVAGTFDASPFSIARGFDIIVDRRSMEIVWESSHGTPAGNDNLEGADVLAAVQDAVANAMLPTE